MEMEKVGIAGFGTMGRELAVLCAVSGFEVRVLKVTGGDYRDSLKKVERLLSFYRRDLSDEEKKETLGSISVTTELSDLRECDIIIETIVEDYEVKENFFSQLGSNVKDDVVVATNTSSLSVTRLSRAFGRQERFIGLHFFNPPNQMKLVEIVPALLTSDETKQKAIEFVNKLGKSYVVVKETPGFIVNRVLVSMAVTAMELVEQGVAGVKEVDDALRLGAGWPVGPFKLMDLVGLDVFLNACNALYAELGEPKYRAPQMLKRYVDAGLLGRKTKRGFYSY